MYKMGWQPHGGRVLAGNVNDLSRVFYYYRFADDADFYFAGVLHSFLTLSAMRLTVKEMDIQCIYYDHSPKMGQ